MWQILLPMAQWAFRKHPIEGAEPERYVQYLAEYKAQLFTASRESLIQGYLLTQVYAVDDYKVLALESCAGINLFQWAEAISPFIIQWARERGCCKVVAGGRKGWSRVLRSLGFLPNTDGYMELRLH